MILKNTLGALIAATFILAATPAFATKTITSPYVTKGKATVEWRGGYEVIEDKDDVIKTRNQFSYGFTDFYELKLSGDTRHTDDDDEFTDLVFENKFQILPKGEYFVDLGLRFDYARALDTNADELGGKILLGKKTGNVSHLMNLDAKHEIGDDSSDDWTYAASYGASMPLTEDLSLGGEWYSDFGNFEGTFDEQKHMVGPVLYGSIMENIKYQAGVLAGVSDAAPDATIKTTINYSFQF